MLMGKDEKFANKWEGRDTEELPQCKGKGDKIKHMVLGYKKIGKL